MTVSYFEWVQDIQAYFWTEEEVNDRLARSWSGPSTRSTSSHTEKGLTMRQAAHWIGVGRVAEAHLTRGLFP